MLASLREACAWLRVAPGRSLTPPARGGLLEGSGRGASAPRSARKFDLPCGRRRTKGGMGAALVLTVFKITETGHLPQFVCDIPRLETDQAIGRRHLSQRTSIVSFFALDRTGSFPFRRQHTTVASWSCRAPRTNSIASPHPTFEHVDR